MKILNPEIGEVIDRMTIVARRCLEAERAGKTKFEIDAEWNALLGWLAERMPEPALGLVVGTIRLASVNAAIWDLTDRIDEASVDDADFGRWAREWNKKRARIVGTLSKKGIA